MFERKAWLLGNSCISNYTSWFFQNFRDFDSETTASIEEHKLQSFRVYGDDYCIVELVTQFLSHVGHALSRNMVLNEIKKRHYIILNITERF